MNSHKNARTTFARRKLLIERIRTMGLMPAALAAGISPRTARKWLGRFRESGEAGLIDRSSRPHMTRSTVDDGLRVRIEQLRRARTPMRTIARVAGRSVATISRVLATLGLSSLKALEPKAPVVRYERSTPGEMLHMDTKKLGRIVRPSHRVTGNSRDSVEGAGWEVTVFFNAYAQEVRQTVLLLSKPGSVVVKKEEDHQARTGPATTDGIELLLHQPTTQNQANQLASRNTSRSQRLRQ